MIGVLSWSCHLAYGVLSSHGCMVFYHGFYHCFSKQSIVYGIKPYHSYTSTTAMNLRAVKHYDTNLSGISPVKNRHKTRRVWNIVPLTIHTCLQLFQVYVQYLFFNMYIFYQYSCSINMYVHQYLSIFTHDLGLKIGYPKLPSPTVSSPPDLAPGALGVGHAVRFRLAARLHPPVDESLEQSLGIS